MLVLLTCFISLGFGYFLGVENKEIKAEDEYIKRFKKNYDYLLENYYDEVNKDTLIDAAIRGMVESLGDEYSEFMTETESNTFDITLEGEYEGAGITVANNQNGDIVIVDIIENSPAGKADIKVGDIIKQVDKENLEGAPTTTLTNYIKKKQKFNLVLQRGEEKIETKITKEKIILPSVQSKLYEKEGKKIGYIQISIFAINTAEQFQEKLKELEKQNINSLIIDVRDNGGGHLVTARQIISTLLDKEKVMYQLKTKGKTTKVYSEGKITKKYPIVILTNQNSASGSEVLTAALKENINAISIGQTTFGKGTVQELKNLQTGSEYKITTKKWLTPKGNDINGKGIKPDIEEVETDKYLQTRKEEDDNQLAKAIEYLQNK